MNQQIQWENLAFKVKLHILAEENLELHKKLSTNE